MNIEELINTDPDAFMAALHEKENGFSLEYSFELDKLGAKEEQLELRYISWKFSFGAFRFDGTPLLPFAAHSLGPVFWPAQSKIQSIFNLQKERLHDGHFPQTKELGGNWFDFDVEPEAIEDMQAMLGFADPCEFIYTQAGLSDNLRLLLSTFYRPSQAEWSSQKTGICFLGKEFFSDQAVIHSLLKGEILRATANNIFTSSMPCPKVDDLCMTISADDRGLYDEAQIIRYVKEHAHFIKILHLSDIVFSTGQRIDLKHVLGELKDVLREHKIMVGLDLAHTVGNRTINLKELPVTYAVGCAYKHMCGPAGSGFGIYVNKDTDLVNYPPIQGWKAAASDQVFPVIDQYHPQIMAQKGARAFRSSNPSPIGLTPVQQYVKAMNKIGWDPLMKRSESLTRYMIALLKKRLGERIEFITPLEPAKRGAMIVFRIKNISNSAAIEQLMKKESEFGRFEIDTRPPNNIRVTAHYGFTKFNDIRCMVMRLEQVIDLQFKKEHPNAFRVSPKEQEFNWQLMKLQTKINDFSQRMTLALTQHAGDDFEALREARWAAVSLHEGLRDARDALFRGNKNSQEFKNQCAAHFQKAHKVLDQHRGMSDFFTNLMLAVFTLGLGLLAKQAFFRIHATDSNRILRDLEDTVQQIAPVGKTA